MPVIGTRTPPRALLVEATETLSERVPVGWLQHESKLQIATDQSQAKQKLLSNVFDLVIVGPQDLALADDIEKQAPDCKVVLVTSEQASAYVPRLSWSARLRNVISHSNASSILLDRDFRVMVSKLATRSAPSPDDYLSPGTPLLSRAIVCNSERSKLLDEFINFSHASGVRKSVTRKAARIADELLMNALFAAPQDGQGNALYNSAPRTSQIELKAEQQGCFRYGCDGDLLVIAVGDPFGALTLETLLGYLASCYQEQAGSLQGTEKAGAGLGLYQVLESSSILCINRVAGRRTEMIAVLAVDREAASSNHGGSLHFFEPAS